MPLDRGIVEIIKHPKYNGGTKKNDIALMRLSSPVPFTDSNIRPACLRTALADVPPNQELYLTGWGATEAESKLKQSTYEWISLICLFGFLSRNNRRFQLLIKNQRHKYADKTM